MRKFKSIDDLLDNISEQELIDYLEEVIGNGNPVSPCHPASKVYKCKNNRYKCKECDKDFNIKAGLSFKKSRIPLRKGFRAIFMIFGQVGGISSYNLAKLIGVSQRTAGYMEDRLRKDADKHSQLIRSLIKLKGVLQIDELYLGGSNSNRHGDKKVPNSQGRSWKDKIPLLGILEENGDLFIIVVPDVKRKTLEPLIRKYVEERSTIYTDEGKSYKGLKEGYEHYIVNHGAKQYVKKIGKRKVSVNSMESKGATFNRRIYGTYIHISKKNAQKYASEFAITQNIRKCKNEQEKFNSVLVSLAIGKGLPCEI